MEETREVTSASELFVDLAAVTLGAVGWTLAIQTPILIALAVVFQPLDEFSQSPTSEVIIQAVLSAVILEAAAMAMLGSARVVAQRRPVWMPIIAAAWLGCGLLILLAVYWPETSSEGSALPGTIWGGLVIVLAACVCIKSNQRRRRNRGHAGSRQ